MRVLSDGRPRAGRSGWPLGFFLSGLVVLSGVGAFVTVRALVEWLT